MANMRTAKVKSKKIKTANSAAGPMGPGAKKVPTSAIGSAISAAGQVPSANIVIPSPVPSANLAQQIDQIEMAKASVAPQVGAQPLAPAPQAGVSLGPTTITQNGVTQTAPKKAKVKKKKGY